MEIRTEVRAIEAHIKTLAATQAEQVAIISKAQSLIVDEHAITVLALVKNRIIRG